MEEGRLTRRRLVGTAAAGAAAATLPVAPAQARRRSHKYDAIVIGAGFSGLAAALALKDAGKDFLVLEARTRVGGRALNKEIGGGEISERGATFIGPTQNHIQALAKRFHVGTFPTFDDGDNLYVNGGQRLTWSDTGVTGTAPPDPLILPDLTLSVALLDQMATEVGVDAPWAVPKAQEYDGQTLETWINGHTVLPNFRRLVPVATRPIFGAEPRELSLLYTLFYIAASGDEQNPGTFERNFNTRGGAQQDRMRGGTQHLAKLVARHLRRRVILDAPVRRIEQNRQLARVITRGTTYRCRRVIVAVPPALARRIHYHPHLHERRRLLTSRLPQGTLIKAAAVYDKPFWRDAGLNGTIISQQGPVNVTFDDSPEDASRGIIFGFIGGDEARKFRRLAASTRRKQVLNQLTGWLGPKAKSPQLYFESDWSAEQWSRGCPVAIAGPGTLSAYGSWLRRPARRIHWAGTETSTYWAGYMDGAVRAGKRAAAEVLAEL